MRFSPRAQAPSSYTFPEHSFTGKPRSNRIQPALAGIKGKIYSERREGNTYENTGNLISIARFYSVNTSNSPLCLINPSFSPLGLILADIYHRVIIAGGRGE